MTGKNKTALNERLIACVKKNEYEEVEKCLKRKADLNYEGTPTPTQKTTRRDGLLSSGPAASATPA
jgi:hypothetical protein